jgi:hypothetical protein
MSPEIDCTVLGIHENWREQQKVVFRKRHEPATRALSAPAGRMVR